MLRAKFARVYFCILITVFSLLSCSCASDPRTFAIELPPPPLIPIQQQERELHVQTIYVDHMILESSCKSYSIGRRSCGEGKDLACRTLAEAALLADAGDTIEIREGVYHEPIAPVSSGASGAPITFRNFPGESVTLSSVDEPAVRLINISHIVVQGIAVTDVLGWGRLENAHYNVISNNLFANAEARGTTGGLKLVKSHFNRVVLNRFERGNDSVVVQESDRNLIGGNVFRWARHSLVSVRCGNFNVIRGNEFHNERQKAVEIYDCEGVSDAPYKLNATKRNVIENNWFLYTRGPSAPHKYNAIQFAGQYGIVRRNVFHGNQGGGVNFQIYSAESLYTYGNRVYHNTFFKNHCYALKGSGGVGEIFGDNLVVNNIFHQNYDCDGRPDQVSIGDPEAVFLQHNAVLSPTEDPGFVSEDIGDLRLRSYSRLVDTGSFLTRTVRPGSGTSLPIEDVLYFSDGFGVPDIGGDMIQLENSRQKARVIGVDYHRRELLLDRPLNWSVGQGVALAYEGKAPDFGAWECPSK